MMRGTLARWRIGRVTAVAIALAIGPLAASAAADHDATRTVAIQSFAFAPQELTVAPGTTVVWTNHDGSPHALRATDKSFTSTAMDTDDSYRHTFDRAGDFKYFCTLHPFMTGVVHVRASAATGSSRR